MRDSMIEELKASYHVDEVFDYFYQDALAQAEDVATLVEMNNAIKKISLNESAIYKLKRHNPK